MTGTDGVVSYALHSEATIAIIIVIFISIALYNVIELIVLTLGTFKKYSGLYFWSLLIATLGIAFNAIGFLFKHLELTPLANLYATLILVGWCTMITGQSVVLYSRLHIVVQHHKILRSVLIMIVVNAIWLHIPVIVLVYGSNSFNPEPFVGLYSIFEKIQLTVFFVQETIISAVYVWETSKILNLQKSIGNGRARNVMAHLIYVNVIVILLDITILVLEYTNKYNIQTAWKPFVYSVKLKLEFSVLNRLVNLVQGRRNGSSFIHSNAVHTPSVVLGTFGPQRHWQSRDEDLEFKTGYSVNVEVGQGNQTLQLDDSSVVKTTEITVHRDEPRKGTEEDMLSLGRKSGVAGECATGELRDRGCISSASSEVHFAHSWT